LSNNIFTNLGEAAAFAGVPFGVGYDDVGCVMVYPEQPYPWWPGKDPVIGEMTIGGDFFVR